MQVIYSRRDGGWVAILGNGGEYFLQGNEAWELITRADDIADLRGVSEQESLQMASRAMGYH